MLLTHQAVTHYTMLTTTNFCVVCRKKRKKIAKKSIVYKIPHINFNLVTTPAKPVSYQEKKKTKKET